MHRLYFFLLAGLLSAGVAAAQSARFPVTQSEEAFGDRPDVVQVRFKFHFPIDPLRYLPVDDDLAAILSIPPDVEAPSSLRARVASSVCTPADLTVYAAGEAVTARGAEIITKIELRPRPPDAVTTQTVTLRYPLIDAVVAKINGISSGAAVARIDVQVWPSVAARDQFLAKEQERQRLEREAEERARIAREQAEARARAARELAERQARREARIRLAVKSIPYFGALFLVASLLFLYRHWLAPDLTVTVGRGSHLQQSLNSTPVDAADAEPGTILRTEWARNWMGFRQRIKVESFVADHVEGAGKHPVDLLVSVGRSVRPGKYVAAGAHGSVKVEVV
jgi:hypothetical protein